MDRATFAAYDKDAAAFAKDWHEQPPPSDLHAIVQRFFKNRMIGFRGKFRERTKRLKACIGN